MSSPTIPVTPSAAPAWQKPLAFFFFAVAFGALLIFFKGEKEVIIEAPTHQTALMEAFSEMMATTGLETKAGAIYTDAPTGAFLKADQPIAFYQTIFQTEKIEPTKAIILHPDAFKTQTTSFAGAKGAAFFDKLMAAVVLRGLIVDGAKGDGYYFLMPMRPEEFMNITYLDATGKKRRWIASYQQAYAFDRFPSGGHYLMMTRPEHREMMKKMHGINGIQALFSREGHGALPDIHLFAIESLITFSKPPEGMVILPLKEVQ